MKQLNKRAIFSIASIFSLRMYGLFLIIPVFSLYVSGLKNADSFYIGIAFGIYGLTQGVMQIPFGAMSDKFGRKKIMSIGLLLFLFGSILAYFAESIEMMIIARAMQGSGAIAAVTLALLADLTSEKERTIAMAIVGGSIGLMFMLGLITGPMWLNVFDSVADIFLLVAVLASIALVLVWTLVPDEPKRTQQLSSSMTQNIKKAFIDGFLMRCNYGIFVLHCVLMCLFLVLPFQLSQQLKLASNEHGWLYAKALGLALILIVFLMRSHHKKQSIALKNNTPLVLSIAFMIIGFLILCVVKTSYLGYLAALFFFLGGFTMIEALLPSTVSKYADASYRGAALGLFNSFEFTGIFIGGLIGGLILKFSSIYIVYLFCIVLLLSWLIYVQLTPRKTA